MKVTQKKVDELNLELTVNVAAEDYAPAKKKRLNDIRRTAEFKGFRKGNVPMSLIEKLYGEQALVEAVNDIISEQLNNHIKSKKLHILAEPLASEKQPVIDWEDGKDFKFLFDVALAPEVSVEVVKEDTVASYTINVTEAAKKDMKDNIRKFDEKKKDKTDEELDPEVTEYLKNSYKQESDYRLAKDIRNYFVEKANFSLPEAFLKRWLISVNKEKFSAEEVEKEFPGFIADFKWQMVRDSLMTTFKHKITDKDLQEAAEAYVSYQYAMYGMGNVPAEIIKESVQNVLTDNRQLQQIEEQVMDSKVMASIKEIITIKPKKISVEKFRELA